MVFALAVFLYKQLVALLMIYSYCLFNGDAIVRMPAGVNELFQTYTFSLTFANLLFLLFLHGAVF